MKVTTLQPIGGEVTGHTDTSLEKADAHSRSQQTNTDQSNAVAKAEQKKLLASKPHLLLGQITNTLTLFILSGCLFSSSLSLHHLYIASGEQSEKYVGRKGEMRGNSRSGEHERNEKRGTEKACEVDERAV